MAQLPDLETWAKEAGHRGAQYALKYLEEEYGVSPQRLIELAQADREGRCVVLPIGGYSDKDGEKALKNAMFVCSLTNNAVNRYTADAIAEKLTRAEAEAALRREQDEQTKP